MNTGSWCDTHLAQQEELVSALLSVLVTRALHLLQVNPIQLELLVDKNTTSIRCIFPHTQTLRKIHKENIMRWARGFTQDGTRSAKKIWKTILEKEWAGECNLNIQEFCDAFHHWLLFPTLIHYKLPSEISLSVQKLRMENKNSNSFLLRILERKWEITSVREKICFASCLVCTAAYLCPSSAFVFYALFCRILSRTGVNPCRDNGEFSECVLGVIVNCSQICAALWQQARVAADWAGLLICSAWPPIKGEQNVNRTVCHAGCA